MDGHGKTILVAEDYESNRKLLGLLLEQAQYEVHLAADGYAALDRMLKACSCTVVRRQWSRTYHQRDVWDDSCRAGCGPPAYRSGVLCHAG